MNIIYRTYRFFRKRIKRLIRCSDVPVGGILMLHSISPSHPDALWANEYLNLSPATLSAAIEYARARGARFVSMDELAEILRKKRYARRVIAITIDDGYRNNYTDALPVFERFQVPFCINITPDVMVGKMLYWWYILEDLLWKNDSLTLSNGKIFQCRTKEEKERAFASISAEYLALSQSQAKERFCELLSGYDIDTAYGNDSLGMTWQQVAALHHHPLATLGNHTMTHSALAQCTIEEAMKEVESAQDLIQSRIGAEMHHFAFPYGSYTPDEKKRIRDMGFRTITTVEEGLLTYGSDLYELPRFVLTEQNWQRTIDTILARS